MTMWESMRIISVIEHCEREFGIRSGIRLAMFHSKFMKLPLSAFFIVASVFVAGCNSLDNPVGGILDTGRDNRVFNAQTGEFEWPKDGQKPRARKLGTAAAGSEPAAERSGDGRYFDLQKNQWVEARQESASNPRAKSKSAPSAPDVAAAPPPMVIPPPARASGVYNPATGQIEWRSFDAASATPKPAPRKNWWWPF
jgi:hypothetical protein